MVSVDASVSVLELQTAPGGVFWRLQGLVLSFCLDLCAGHQPCGVLVGSNALPPIA